MVFDPAARSLTSVRAGHNPPLLYHPEREGRCIELKPGGMGLGIVDKAIFEPKLERLELPVKVGDVMLLYTDGLVEAADTQGRQFGVDRIIQSLGTTYGYPPSVVVSELSKSLDAFTGTTVAEDDVTAVCVRFG